ncbi:MAG: hypothetical protein M1457_11130, partial [bacterium]|nr:hypothetical protein [bacterium]
EWDRDDPPGFQPWLKVFARPAARWGSWIGQPVTVYRVNQPQPPASWPFELSPLECLPRRGAAQPWAAEIEGREAVIQDCNGALVYDVDFPTSGPCTMEMTALNARGTAALYEVDLDGAAAGMLSYYDADGQWATRRLNMRAAAGRHRLEIRLLSDLLRPIEAP